MAPPQSVVAQFTADDPLAAIRCGRPDCPIKLFAPGTQLKYLHSANPSRQGRLVCDNCYNYYQRKGGSITRVFTTYLMVCIADNDL